MKVFRKAILIVFILFIGLNLYGCGNKEETKYSLVASNFPCYDFLRAIVKDDSEVDVKMLLKPGAEIHDFDPTPQDIINIKKSDLFLYVGGESDEWVDSIVDSLDDNNKILKLMDMVDVVEEEVVDGMQVEEDEEEGEEYDEHVWTSVRNAISIIDQLKNEVIRINPNNKDLYEKNANEYISELTKVDEEFKSVVDSSKRSELIFGDRFPFRYFVRDYNLSYYAAFPGCSSETEANAKTISFLIDKVKSDKISVVLKLELSQGKIADTIALETGAKVLELNSAHNISNDDFENGVTYLDIMRNNVNVLREALN